MEVALVELDSEVVAFSGFVVLVEVVFSPFVALPEVVFDGEPV